MFSWFSGWGSPANPAYNPEGDDELRRSLNSLDKMDDESVPKVQVAQPGDRPPPPSSGHPVIEPVIAKSAAPEYSSANKVRRSSYERLDRTPETPPAVGGAKNNPSEPVGRSGPSKDDHRAASSMSQASQKSTSTVIQHIPDDMEDDFPWTPPRKDSHTTLDMDATSVTMHDMRRPSDSAKAEADDKKRTRFLWWKKMVKRLQDNKIQTTEAMQQLLLLDQLQDKHFRLIKKIMNVVFLSAGIILLLAVIVLLISTDPQFDASLKALTVFLAGRRQGIW